MALPTRKRLIDAARARFHRDGFRNVGLEAILGDVGLSKTAFYKHFASKDDLMVAVLDDADDLYRQEFRQLVRECGGPTAVGQLRAVMEVVDRVMNRDGFHGCIFINAVLEFPLNHDPAHAAAVRHRRALQDFFFELAERGRADDPKAMAEELCLIVEGAYVTRALTGDPKSIGVAHRLTDCLIQRHLPGVPG